MRSSLYHTHQKLKLSWLEGIDLHLAIKIMLDLLTADATQFGIFSKALQIFQENTNVVLEKQMATSFQDVYNCIKGKCLSDYERQLLEAFAANVDQELMDEVHIILELIFKNLEKMSLFPQF